MAYVSPELKARIAPQVKKICQKYGVSGTLSVRNHSTLVLTIKKGKLNFFDACLMKISQPGSIDVNPYWYRDHFEGKPKEFLIEIFDAMNKGNHDRSDIQTDYFYVGWYVSVNIGKWNKPYVKM
jgi:hypothetical protein